MAYTNKDIEIIKTVAFTGYRLAKIMRAVNKLSITEIADRCYDTVKMLYENGYNTFLSGGAEGFDMIAARAVIRLRNETEGAVRLIMVLPFIGQDERYSLDSKREYNELCSAADMVIALASKYENDSQFLRRNDYLLAHSACLVCCYDGSRGGTMYTVNRAIKAEMPIFNILPYEVKQPEQQLLF